MSHYAGRVSLSGSSANARARIRDVDSPAWRADVRDITEFDFQPGLIAVELIDGGRAGLVAIGELRYPAGSPSFPYREGPAVVFARTPFERRGSPG